MKVFDVTCKFAAMETASLVLVIFVGVANAQNITPPSAIAKPASTPSVAKPASDDWQTLTPAQKLALQPLNAVWSSLTEAHKRKWLALSTNFAKLTEQEKITMYGRMTEWANLTTKQRELARINFAKTKQLSTDDKQSKWQAYQSLSAEEKQKLANINKTKQSKGAAPVIKPVAKDKLVTTSVINDGRPKVDNKTNKRAVINNQDKATTPNTPPNTNVNASPASVSAPVNAAPANATINSKTTDVR